jgi:glycosyltransferase involved in cell wall biosynthesis
MAQAVFEFDMRIVWILDKEFDVALNVSARLATIEYLEKRHDLTVVTSFRREKKEFTRIRSRIIYLKSARIPVLKLLSLYYRQLRLVRRFLVIGEFDLVLVNSTNFLLLKKLVRARRDREPKLVFDVRTLPTESNPLKKGFNRLLLKKSLQVASRHFDGITYITETLRKYCEERFRLPHHRSEIWGTGVDLDRFRPRPFVPAAVHKLKLMYHGKVADNRGIDNVVRALSRLADLDVELLVLGKENEFRTLKKIVSELGLRGQVNLFRHVQHERVPDFIAQADAGILPFPDLDQWNTSSAIKLFEYLACGRPVVLTRLAAHREVLDGREFAFWSETSGPESLEIAIRAAASRKPDFSRLGRDARLFVESRFGWEKQLGRLEEFIRSL